MREHVKWTCHLNFNKYNTRVLGVSFHNQRLQLLSHLQNNVTSNLKVFHPLVIIILCHENCEYHVVFYALTLLPISWFFKRSKLENSLYWCIMTTFFMAWKKNMQSHSQINFPWALSNHYCHEIIGSIDFAFAKQHESNELKKTLSLKTSWWKNGANKNCKKAHKQNSKRNVHKHNLHISVKKKFEQRTLIKNHLWE